MSLAQGSQNALNVACGLPAATDIIANINTPTPTSSTVTGTTSTTFTVAAAGTNYIFQVDTSTASAVVGLKVKGGAAGGGVALSVINGNALENLTIDAEGAGQVIIGSVSTGLVVVGRGANKAFVESLKKTSFAATQSITPTAAQLIGGYINHGSTTGAGTCTFDTGTNIEAQIPGAVNGDSFTCFYANTGTQTVTLTTAAGLTLIGTVAITTGKVAQLTFVRTSANNYDVIITSDA